MKDNDIYLITVTNDKGYKILEAGEYVLFFRSFKSAKCYLWEHIKKKFSAKDVSEASIYNPRSMIKYCVVVGDMDDISDYYIRRIKIQEAA